MIVPGKAENCLSIDDLFLETMKIVELLMNCSYKCWMLFDPLFSQVNWCCTYEIVVGQLPMPKHLNNCFGVFGFSFGRPMNEDRCRIGVINPLGYINISAKECYKSLHSDIDQNNGEKKTENNLIIMVSRL